VRNPEKAMAEKREENTQLYLLAMKLHISDNRLKTALKEANLKIVKISLSELGYRARILTYWPSGYFKAASKQEALECIKLSHMLEQYAPLLCYFRARDAVRWQA
jgi:hypothetical protein